MKEAGTLRSRGVAEIALYWAHRSTVIHIKMILPSLLVVSSRMGAD
jgi:hypothetical protein